VAPGRSAKCTARLVKATSAHFATQHTDEPSEHHDGCAT
jgi:hypothetical protein